MAFSASAGTTYYLGVGTNAQTPPKCFKFYSDETTNTVVTSVTPSANDGNTYVVLASGKMSAYTAPSGTTWIFGKDGSAVGTTAAFPTFQTNPGTFNFGACTIYGINAQINGDGSLNWGGTNTLVNCGQTFEFSAINVNAKPRGVELSGKFISDTDVTINMTIATYPKEGVNPSEHKITGDFSEFKGGIALGAGVSAAKFNGLELTSASAFGDSSVSRDDYLTVGKLTRWTIGSDVTQYATKGIQLNLSGTDTSAMYAADGASWTLSAPVTTKTDGVGTLEKTGAGTITLAGSLSVPNLDVKEGTLVIDSTATFARATTLTIRSGATVITRKGMTIDNVTFVKEDGSILSLDFTVPYANGTTTALDCSTLTAAEWEAMDKPLPLKLSESIPHPNHMALRLPMLKLPTALGAKASDFDDTTGKTYDLPVTTFEVVTEDGYDIVYMNVRSVIYLNVLQSALGTNPNLLDAKQTDSSGKEYDTWTDGQAAHAGADYVVANGSWARTTAGWLAGTWTFPGESLTFANNSAFMTKAMSNVVKRLVFYGGTYISLSGFKWGENVHVIDGKCCIASGTVQVSLSAGTSGDQAYWRVVDFAGPLTGSGTLSFMGDPGGHSPRISGDGSAFAGKILNGATGTESAPTLLECPDLSKLLAERTDFDKEALKASGAYSGFHVTADGTLADKGFGLMLSGAGAAISVAEGKTLTVAGKMTLANATTSKRGGGTLALAGTTLYGTSAAAAPGDSDSYCLELRGGWVKPMAWNDGVSYSRTRFKAVAADSGFAFDAAPTDEEIAKYGLRLVYDDSISFDTGIETLPIKIDLPETLALVNGMRKVTSTLVVPVLTVTDTCAAAIAGKLSLVKNYRGAKGTITSAATDGLTGYTTFTATIEPAGLAIIIR